MAALEQAAQQVAPSLVPSVLSNTAQPSVDHTTSLVQGALAFATLLSTRGTEPPQQILQQQAVEHAVEQAPAFADIPIESPKKRKRGAAAQEDGEQE
jgi:hypothetical protein